MASQNATDLLRVVTQRLSSTPVKQLPHITPYLATSIAQHGRALAGSSNEGQVGGESESTVLVHKLKTQLSALLQDKNLEARYAAVILIRSTVEVGGWIVLQGAGSWVRGLISILGRPEPPTTKRLCVITLTRIFLLTHKHQSLIRELTTPSLPGFIASCLNLTKSVCSPQVAPECYAQSPLLLVVLHALSELIAIHPTLFRPFVSQIHSLTYPLIAPTPSNSENLGNPTSTSASVSESARQLFVLLHVTGPKNTPAEEWARSLDAVIVSVQRTADRVFRSLIEDWTSPGGSHDVANPNPVEDIVSDQAPTPLALPAWIGIYAGVERLEGLLHIVQAFLATASSAAVTLPVGKILNLVDRILSVFPPGNERTPRLKPEIGRDEREGLWIGLPRLQTSALGICSLMISRMGHSSAAIACTVLEQLLWIFESQHGNDDFRKAAYTLVSQILSTFGPSLPKTYATSLSRCIRLCCEDLLPSAESHLPGGQASLSNTTKATNGVNPLKNADSYLKAASNGVEIPVTSASVHQAARGLLTLALTNLPNEFLRFSLRCQIDRTAIITNNKDAMLASVMNPNFKYRGKKPMSSILPLLARAHPEALQVEALLRPQMPPLQCRQSDGRDLESDEQEGTHKHNHSQIDESNGFDYDLAGTCETANIERNTVSGHSDVQADHMLGAVEENSAGREPTTVPTSTLTGLQEPKLALSYTPKKRDREEGPDPNTTELVAGDSTEQVGVEVASKRPRMGLGETHMETSLETAPLARPIADAGGTGQTVVETPATDFAAMSNRQSNKQLEGSDESEFEMPTLYLDSDSDEEEEEGGEGEEEEDG